MNFINKANTGNKYYYFLLLFFNLKYILFQNSTCYLNLIVNFLPVYID